MTLTTDPWAPPGRRRARRPAPPGSDGGATRPPAVVVLSVLLALAIIAVAAAAMLPRSNSTPFDPTGAAGGAPLAAAKSALGLGPTTAPTAPTTAAPTTAGGAAAAPDSVQGWLPKVEQFVAADRGLAFKAPVKLIAMSDADFRKHLAGAPQTAKDLADLDHAAKEMKALGLIPASTDLNKAEQSLQGGTVVGLYDPSDKTLYVRGTTATPYVRQVMAHELTHALQDQWFGLNRPALDNASDESGMAFEGVVEGDARRVESDYHRALSDAEQKQADAEEQQIAGGGIDASIPDVLVTLEDFPYDVGQQFVEAILQAGGQSRLDQAFRQPPTTSRQLLNPDVFLAGHGAAPVAAPQADGPAFDHTVLGEIGLILMLNESEPVQDARIVADLWGGDSMVAWTSGAKTCVRDRLVTSADPTLLGGALLVWAKAHPGATVSGTGPFVITSCV